MVRRNDDGSIAIKWVINPNGKTIQIEGTNRYYVFIPQNHVVMSWVQEQDVARLLSFRQKTCNCGGGMFKNAFEYANLIDVNVFTYNNRHGSLESNYVEVDQPVNTPK
jgi:hypothetical protein